MSELMTSRQMRWGCFVWFCSETAVQVAKVEMMRNTKLRHECYV